MIRFLSVLIANEQSMVEDLNLPPFVSIVTRCSKKQATEIGLAELS